MTKEQALQNINQVCAAYKGTREDHVTLQESIRVLEKGEPAKEDGDKKNG